MRPRAGTTERDPLSDALECVRLEGALFFLWEASWPYVSDVPAADAFASLILPDAQQIVSYHVVTEGTCWAAIAGEPPVRLDPGDILLVPHGDAYAISSTPQRRRPVDPADALSFFRAMAGAEAPAIVREGGAGPGRNMLICGFLGCDARPFNPVLSMLPPLLRVPAPSSADPLTHLVAFALAESRQTRLGSRCMLRRLSELMFVEVVRRHVASAGTGHGGWLGGLADPIVGRALALLHGHPGRRWSLPVLAAETATSRSALAERFTRLVGQPPMQYLARWRMQVAARALMEPHVKVSAVARDVGYASEAAFTRAFTRAVGCAPAAWRLRGRRSTAPRRDGRA